MISQHSKLIAKWNVMIYTIIVIIFEKTNFKLYLK